MPQAIVGAFLVRRCDNNSTRSDQISYMLMNSLQEEFLEFCPLTDEDLLALKTPTYVLDSNVLLHLYRYSDPVRQQFLELLGSVQKQLFIPYQVALEFHRNRAGVIADQLAI